MRIIRSTLFLLLAALALHPIAHGADTTAVPNAARATNTSVKYVFMTPPAPDFDYLGFDFDTENKRRDDFGAASPQSFAQSQDNRGNRHAGMATHVEGDIVKIQGMA